MVKVYSRRQGDSTNEDMNALAGFLLEHKMIETLGDNCGVQECSEALCDFEVHVIKKNNMNWKLTKEASHIQADDIDAWE